MRTLVLCSTALLFATAATAAGPKDPAKTAAELHAPPAQMAAAAQPASFSVEMHMVADGKEVVMKRTVDGGKTRMDMDMDGHQMTVISLDDEKKTSYMIDPEHKRAMKQSLAGMQKKAEGHVPKDAEPAEHPADAQPAGQIEFLGKETIDGREADKYKVSYGESGTGTMWIDSANNLPLRMEAKGSTVDFKNYQFGPQPAEAFIPPKNYEVTDMDEMMSKMGGMGGVGGMAKGMAGGMMGGMAGGMGGSLGSTIGGALGGPIGAMAGQFVGQKIGQKIGHTAAHAVTGN